MHNENDQTGPVHAHTTANINEKTKIISSIVIFAVLVLRLRSRRPYNVL